MIYITRFFYCIKLISAEISVTAKQRLATTELNDLLGQTIVIEQPRNEILRKVTWAAEHKNGDAAGWIRLTKEYTEETSSRFAHCVHAHTFPNFLFGFGRRRAISRQELVFVLHYTPLSWSVAVWRWRNTNGIFCDGSWGAFRGIGDYVCESFSTQCPVAY